MNEPNQYSYGSLGERFAVEDPTDVDRMNKSRIKVDHVYEALNTSGFMSTINPVSTPMVLSRRSLVRFPDSTQTTQNGRRVIHVDLDDPSQVWDLEAFKQYMQDTSWHDELGDPPVHGAMWITEDQTSLVWWDREKHVVYMQFNGGATSLIQDATPVLTDLAFLDGRIYVSGTGGVDLTIVDLLRDGAWKHDTGGIYQYRGDITARNGSSDWENLSTGLAIIHATVNSTGAMRHATEIDEFGRPAHWWAALTGGGS